MLHIKIYFTFLLTKWRNIVSSPSGHQPRGDVWSKGDIELRSIQSLLHFKIERSAIWLGKRTNEVSVLRHPAESSVENNLLTCWFWFSHSRNYDEHIIFWYVTCSTVEVHRRCGGTYWSHLLRYRTSKSQTVRRLFLAGQLLRLLFDPEDGSNTFLRNFGAPMHRTTRRHRLESNIFNLLTNPIRVRISLPSSGFSWGTDSRANYSRNSLPFKSI